MGTAQKEKTVRKRVCPFAETDKALAPLPPEWAGWVLEDAEIQELFGPGHPLVGRLISAVRAYIALCADEADVILGEPVLTMGQLRAKVEGFVEGYLRGCGFLTGGIWG